jgi:hypothetical protein
MNIEDKEADGSVAQQAEFEEAAEGRRRLDMTAWTAAMTARAQMPQWSHDRVDANVVELARRGIGKATFVGADKARATVRPVKSSVDDETELYSFDVTLKGAADVGTLVIPVTAERLQAVLPLSLALYRWDEASKAYDLIPQSGVRISEGFVYGHIDRSGRYAVLGLPTEASKLRRGASSQLLRHWIQLLYRRVFDPSGPWSPLGPQNLSCCMVDLAIDPSNSDRLYAAASDGGLWRLDSVASYPTLTWIPLTDGQPTLQALALAVSPADSRVVYYADATGQLRRSSDSGTSWSTPSSTSIGTARRLIAHPSDANTLWAATSTGLWCTHTGGLTWSHNVGQTTLHDGDILDAVMDVGSAAVMYIAQRSVGVLKTYDSGATWRVVLPWSRANTPADTEIRLALGQQGSDTTRRVAVRFDQEVLVNSRGGRDSTVAGGGPWTSRGKVGGSGYGYWCHVIAVDPHNDDVILSGAQQLYRTTNGGANWSIVIDYYNPHEDQHRVVFDAATSGVVYAANDGGVFRSTDGGATWKVDDTDVANRRDLNHGLVTAQFYTAAISGDHALGNLYHQGIAAADSLRRGEWAGVEGHAWEFNSVAGDPHRAGTYYVFGGLLFRRDFPGPAVTAITTFQPTAVAVDGSGNLIVGASDGTIHRTSDPSVATPAWTTMGGLPPSSDPVRAIAVASGASRRGYLVTNSGQFYWCADTSGAGHWSIRTPIFGGGVIALAVDPADESVVYAATSTTVFRTVDTGVVWTEVHGSGATAIPASSQLRSLVAGNGALYLLAATGVFTSADRGATWYDFSAGLPHAELMELLWTGDDLFAVTHGRGIWHHGRYDVYPVLGPVEHIPDLHWLIELWLRIHGGDPVPDIVRPGIGVLPRPFVQGRKGQI